MPRVALDQFIFSTDDSRVAPTLPPGHTPASVHRYAALIVVAHVMRREVWHEERVLSVGEAKRMKRGTPPVPKDTKTRTHTRIETSRAMGDGGRLARVGYYTDKYEHFREVYVPRVIRTASGLHSFESTLEYSIGRSTPAVLKVDDLTMMHSAAAYRSQSKRRAPKFHGHGFGDCIRTARQGLALFLARGDILREAIHAYAWPLLWIRYAREYDRVVFAAPDGTARYVAADSY